MAHRSTRREQSGRPRPPGVRRHLGALGVQIAALSAVLALPALAWAGPWVKAPGELYAKVSGGAFRGTGLLDVEGRELEDPEFSYNNTSVNLYLETGLAPRLGLAVNLPVLFSVNEISERERAINNGLGDLDATLQFQVHRGQACPVALNLAVRVPLYEGIVGEGATPGVSDSNLVGNRPEDRLRRFIPALGDGSTDVSPMLAVGCSLLPLAPGWFSAEAGPQFRSDGFGNGVRYAADVGMFLWPERLGLGVRVDGQERFSGENERPTKRLVSLSSTLFVRLWDGLSLEATGSWVPTGAFLAKGWGAILGVSYSGRVFSDPYEL